MTNREFHLQCRRNETLAFHRVINALPHDRYQYAPHEKSQSAERIVKTLIGEADACSKLIDTGELQFVPPPDMPPAKTIEAFDRAWDGLVAKIEGMDEAGWNRPAKFVVGGQVRAEQPVSGFLWLFFFDAIHHRGQLSAYIRPMGGKVPSIYGPSGDDPMMLSAAHKKME